MFATSVALPIAWLHLDADVESSRARKQNRVKEGAESVCQLQQRFRNGLLDARPGFAFFFWGGFCFVCFWFICFFEMALKCAGGK